MNDPRLLQLHADLQSVIASLQGNVKGNKPPSPDIVTFMQGLLVPLESYLSDTGWASDVQTVLATQKANGGRTSAPGQQR